MAVPSDVIPILIDNALDTGTTIMSAMKALNRTLYVVVLGNTHNFLHFNYPINLYEQSLTLQ
jgi:phosphoribosylpyrophosphate synthetase